MLSRRSKSRDSRAAKTSGPAARQSAAYNRGSPVRGRAFVNVIQNVLPWRHNMPKTVVGLFETPSLVDGVVHAIEALGFPGKKVRTLTEPTSSEVRG